MEALLSVEQAQALLGISEPTLYRLIRADEIAVVKIGDRTLFRPIDLEQFVKRRLRGRSGAQTDKNSTK